MPRPTRPMGDILVDGHNRHEICTRHNIPFKTVSMEFDSREEAMVWIISTQFARRNLTPMQQTILRGTNYLLEMKIKKNEEGRNQHSEVRLQNAVKPTNNATAAELGEKFKVNQATIWRDGMSPSHPFQLTIFMLMDDLSSELQEVEADDVAAQRTALRSYIDKLEELYESLHGY